ncbi:hypothetical protein GB937_006115 [Aspergillus fischeri]|nr:hypothetical protein GB937_006115 [Aspergillus fischeri]
MNTSNIVNLAAAWVIALTEFAIELEFREINGPTHSAVRVPRTLVNQGKGRHGLTSAYEHAIVSRRGQDPEKTDPTRTIEKTFI